jgi:uncharacterized membrane protein YhaH (DUF805 family)
VLQQLVESNDYLPSLSKDGHAGMHIVPKSYMQQHHAQSKIDIDTKKNTGIEPRNATKEIARGVANHALEQVHSHLETAGEITDAMKQALRREAEKHFKVHKGLFRGRLRRKDFTLGFIFFFAVGYVTLALSAVVISIFVPELWTAILTLIEQDTNDVLLLTIPVILAPITVMMLSLITRRLHNLGLPGSLSWLYLVMFIPVNMRIFSGMWYVYVALFLLFIVLLAKKGEAVSNEYGAFPESRGSFFKRIFNI